MGNPPHRGRSKSLGPFGSERRRTPQTQRSRYPRRGEGGRSGRRRSGALESWLVVWMRTLFSNIKKSRAERPCGRPDSTGVLAIGTFAFERTSSFAAAAGRASRNGIIRSSVRNAEAEKSAAHATDAYCGRPRAMARDSERLGRIARPERRG